MTKEFWTVTEVVEIFQVDERFIEDLEEEDVVCPICRKNTSTNKPTNMPTKLFSAGDLENLRLAKVLVEDMGLNLAGVEVVLRMRQSMIDMRRQFDAILEDLAKEFQESFNKVP